MDILNKIIILILPLLLSSCFQEFDPNIESKPKLCINSLITPGDTIKVDVTRTWTWTEGDINDEYNSRGIDLTIYDAEVNLYVNGEYIETLQPKIVLKVEGIFDYGYPFIHRYVSNYLPKVGDEIKIVAMSDKYGEAWGTVIIPDPPHLETVTANISNVKHSISEWAGTESLDFILTMALDFSDNSDTSDYYKFIGTSSKTETSEGYIYPLKLGYLDSSYEPLFSEHVSALESVVSQTSGYLFFSDIQISGKTYPLHIRYDNASYSSNQGLENLEDEDPIVTLTLATISKSYYDHVISVWVANDGVAGTLGSVGLGDPIFASSNVSTEAGVIAAQSPASIEIHIGDKLREAIKHLEYE